MAYGTTRWSQPLGLSQLHAPLRFETKTIGAWMQSSRLQLNTAKTKVIWCASNRRQDQLPQVALRVGTDHVTPTTSVRDLGIYVDCNVSMRTHVSRTVSSCFAVLRQLHSIRRSVSPAVPTKVAGRLAGPVWITATPRLPVNQETSSTDCSRWSVPQHGLFALHEITSTLRRYSATFIGCRWASELSLNSPCSSFAVYTWRPSCVVWRTLTQEGGCALRQRLLS